jgi:hypothetical protein
MPLFKIKLWDKHEIQTFNEEGKNVMPHPEDDVWHKFIFFLETDRIRIDYFKEYVLFDSNMDLQPCVKIYLNDNTTLLGRYSYTAFEKYYNEVYLPLIPPTLSDIVENLKE